MKVIITNTNKPSSLNIIFPIDFLVVVVTELLSMDIKPYTFSYSELKNATQDFNPSSKLGEGGFGSVYKVSHMPNQQYN